MNNLNYSIESKNYILGKKVSKVSFIFFVFIEILFFLAIFLPLMFMTNILISLITFGVLSILNGAFAWEFKNSSGSFYQVIYLFIRYKNDFQKISSESIYQAKKIYDHENTIAIVFENKLIIKSFFEISVNTDNDEILDSCINSFYEYLAHDEDLKFYSISANLNVYENINQLNSLIKKQIDFKKPKKEILDDLKNKLLIQQLQKFTSLEMNENNHKINVIEFQKIIPLDQTEKKTKIDLLKDKNYLSFLQTFKQEEESFRKNSNNYLSIDIPNASYLKSIKDQLLFNGNKKEFIFKQKYVKVKNKESTSYWKFLKLDSMPPHLSNFWLYEILNNDFGYDCAITFHPISEKDEIQITNDFERNNVSALKKTKLNKKRMAAKQEIYEEILEEQLLEMTSNEMKSRGMSILVKIEAQSPKELLMLAKEFKITLKRKRMLFVDLFLLQKEAFLDFHLGLESKFNSRGKEKKYILNTKKFNNVNRSTIWTTPSICAASLPFKWKVSLEKSGLVYGNDMLNNPTAIDIEISRPNKHISIIGQTGSGKTTAAEFILIQKLIKLDEREPLILMIDVKNEYKSLVKKLKGREVDLSNGFINPFENLSSENPDSFHFVELFLKNLMTEMSIDVNSIIIRIMQILKNYFSKKEAKTLNFDSFYKLIKKNIDLKKIIGNQNFNMLLDFFHQYTSNGVKSHLFSKQNKIQFNNHLTSFNFEGLINAGMSNETNTLIFAVLYFLSSSMKQNDSKFKDKHKYNITILVDEFHLLVNSENPTIIKQFDTLYALSRSFGVSIITITQNLQILNNPKVKNHSVSIFQNTAYFFLFSQQKSQLKNILDLMPENIEITESEKNQLTSGIKHQSLVIFENQKKFIQWNLGLLYDPIKDENTDNLKDIRLSEFKMSTDIANEYIDLMKERN